MEKHQVRPWLCVPISLCIHRARKTVIMNTFGTCSTFWLRPWSPVGLRKPSTDESVPERQPGRIECELHSTHSALIPAPTRPPPPPTRPGQVPFQCHCPYAGDRPQGTMGGSLHLGKAQGSAQSNGDWVSIQIRIIRTFGHWVGPEITYGGTIVPRFKFSLLIGKKKRWNCPVHSAEILHTGTETFQESFVTLSWSSLCHWPVIDQLWDL